MVYVLLFTVVRASSHQPPPNHTLTGSVHSTPLQACSLTCDGPLSCHVLISPVNTPPQSQHLLWCELLRKSPAAAVAVASARMQHSVGRCGRQLASRHSSSPFSATALQQQPRHQHHFSMPPLQSRRQQPQQQPPPAAAAQQQQQQPSPVAAHEGGRPVLLFDVMDTIVTDPFFEAMPRFFNMSFKELLAAKHPTGVCLCVCVCAQDGGRGGSCSWFQCGGGRALLPLPCPACLASVQPAWRPGHTSRLTASPTGRPVHPPPAVCCPPCTPARATPAASPPPLSTHSLG